jgi:hypothetical protein
MRDRDIVALSLEWRDRMDAIYARAMIGLAGRLVVEPRWDKDSF